MRSIRLALLLALAAPAAAHAAEATIVSRDLPVGNARLPAAVRLHEPFSLVGLHWRGAGRVVFRTRSLSGRWSSWRTAAPEAEDLPDAADPERVSRRSWRIGNPYWTGPSDRIEYRLSGAVSRLRAYFVSVSATALPARTLSVAGSPALIPRAGWGADERLLRRPPAYAPAVRLALVHHTAGANDYRPEESAAIVRAIALYHVRGNGWNDIGYNFLVDRFGRVFEGRYGGVEANVVGAHAEGFNTGSIGVAVIGSYGSRALSRAAERALARLLAWRLDVAHVDPLAMLALPSRGNARFPAGAAVFLRTVSGHRDTGFTACPGEGVYRRLDAVARRAASAGLPKLYEPSVQGAIGGAVRFSARLSKPLPWTVTVWNSAGAQVARGSGFGASVAWRWQSASAPLDRYSWSIDAGRSVRPVRGELGSLPPPAPVLPPPLPLPPEPAPPPEPLRPLIAELGLSPGVVSPNGDGYSDDAEIAYTLSVRSSVTAVVEDESGAVVATLFGAQRQSARRIAFRWSPHELPDGRYVLAVSAEGDDGRVETVETAFAVDRVLAGVTASPAVFSPNADGVDDAATFSFSLSGPATVSVEVRQGDRTLAVLLQSALEPGTYSVPWDGTVGGVPAPSGVYEVLVTAVDGITSVSQPFVFEIAGAPP